MRISGRKSSASTRSLSERAPVILFGLVAANATFFIAQLVVEFSQPGFARAYLAISDAGVRDAYAWQFVSAALLHSGPWHFLANVLVLYWLGRDLEPILGRRHFLYLYVAGAIGGELGHLFLMPSQSVLFAASGGVLAVMIAYAAILPELDVTGNVLFGLPLRVKAKHVARAMFVLAVGLICLDRAPVVTHSAWLGGCAAGWLYAHLLGFGRPSFIQRFLRERREAAQRFARMTVEELMVETIDPLLDKIAANGLASLSRSERRSLDHARDKILEKQR